MSEPMIAKIIELLPNHQAKVLCSDKREEQVSLELCGCASLGDTVFIRNGLVLYKSYEDDLSEDGFLVSERNRDEDDSL